MKKFFEKIKQHLNETFNPKFEYDFLIEQFEKKNDNSNDEEETILNDSITVLLETLNEKKTK